MGQDWQGEEQTLEGILDATFQCFWKMSFNMMGRGSNKILSKVSSISLL